MSRVRNAVVIIILCIIGAYTVSKKKPALMLPGAEDLRDSLAAGPSHRAGRPLRFNQGPEDGLRDSLAESPAFNTGLGGNQRGNSDDAAPPPPRGGGGGIGTLSAPNQGNQFPPQDPPPDNLSPSGPPSEEGRICPSQVSCEQ